MNNLIPNLVTTLALATLVACNNEPVQSPSAGLTKPIDPPQPPDLGRGPPMVEVEPLYNIYVGESVRVVCSGPAPFFAFDASKPLKDDQQTMMNLVACMTSGPLSGKTIRLIGHADPRGTAEYNEKLGFERASKVKSFLVTHGISESRVKTASLGEKDAGQAPRDWAGDRRVEVQLVQ